MDSSAPVFEELVPEVMIRAVPVGDGPRVEPIHEAEGGRQGGLVVESALERVAVFSRRGPELSLADVSTMRRSMRQAQARRALVCVPTTMSIPNPVLLLATLSKIEVIRLQAAQV